MKEPIKNNAEFLNAIKYPKSMKDQVNNPYEAIKVIEKWNLGFHLGNVLKYIARAGKKDKFKVLEDLKKARWYLDRQIQNLDMRGKDTSLYDAGDSFEDTVKKNKRNAEDEPNPLSEALKRFKFPKNQDEGDVRWRDPIDFSALIGKEIDSQNWSKKMSKDFFKRNAAKKVNVSVRGEQLDTSSLEKGHRIFYRTTLLAKIEEEFGPGCAAVCKERARQKEVKGYDIKRDRVFYEHGELAQASVAYALDDDFRGMGATKMTFDRKHYWPWDMNMYKPSPDNRQREWEKAGALLAAQIDLCESSNDEKKEDVEKPGVSNLRMQKNYECTKGDTVIMHEDTRHINFDLANSIKGETLYGILKGRIFEGRVWWSNGNWNCEVWQEEYMRTYSSKSLNDLRDIIIDQWGQ